MTGWSGFCKDSAIVTLREILMVRIIFCLMLLITGSAKASEQWFETFKKTATPTQMYQFLYAMPKGGDLHNHLSGAGLSEWWYDIAVDEKANGGYRYYTKVSINNCDGYGHNEFGMAPYLLRFVNIQKSTYETLNACRQSEFKALLDLDSQEKVAWLNSIRLDKAYEGRDEFFQTHWQRLNELGSNPIVIAHILLKNMQAFGAEGLTYLEFQSGVFGFIAPDGAPIPAEEVANIYRDLLVSKAAKATGVTVRLQISILRFAPNAEEMLARVYRFVDQNRDLYVGINMVGREDNDKGYPLRFLPTLRALRKEMPPVRLAIHAGEVDEPNYHVRDTLLLGAERIGHGVNLISDPGTMLLMRNSNNLVEINLVSNLLLEYVDDYAKHPFPEYLRFGIPVALSTDDRGMWDSNMTDEFYTAVSEFNLSWSEVKQLSVNSIQYGFVETPEKQRLLKNLDSRLKKFERAAAKNTLSILAHNTVAYGHACRKFLVCDFDPR